MNQSAPAKMTESERVEMIRQRLASTGDDWLIMAESDHVKIVRQVAEGLEEILTFAETASYDDRDLVMSIQSDLRFLLSLFDRSVKKVRELKALLPEEKDYTAQAAMLCSDPAFKRFMADKHGAESPLTDERVATRLRSVLRISSRRELNENEPAATRWKTLFNSFENWKRHG